MLLFSAGPVPPGMVYAICLVLFQELGFDLVFGPWPQKVHVSTGIWQPVK